MTFDQVQQRMETLRHRDLFIFPDPPQHEVVWHGNMPLLPPREQQEDPLMRLLPTFDDPDSEEVGNE